jgi:hypothetical protein
MEKCYLCKEDRFKCEMSIYRLSPQEKPVGLICADCRNKPLEECKR